MQACFSCLPAELIQEIAKHVNYATRYRLSKVDRRTRGILEPMCKNLESFSIKGNIMSNEFYMTIELEEDLTIRRAYTLTKTRQTELQVTITRNCKIYPVSLNGDPLSCVRQYMKTLFEKYRFRMINIGAMELVHLLEYYKKPLEEIVIGDGQEAVEHIYRLQPLKITVYQMATYDEPRFLLNLKRIPRLKILITFSPVVNVDDFIESDIFNFVSFNSPTDVTPEQAKRLIQNWESGSHPYDRIEIGYDGSDFWRGWENAQMEYHKNPRDEMALIYTNPCRFSFYRETNVNKGFLTM